jgi:CRISPR-associated protein Cmr4
MLHDMALYRQSRVKLLDEMKKVDTVRGAFFNTEALPEGSILVFPIALKESGWRPFGDESNSELYFGGLESIGFGRCHVSLAGDY